MPDKDDIKLCAIVAMSENHVIGRDNDLPWHIPGDLKRVKNITMGKPLIMGRKTFESLGKPLPGRTNIIVSRSGYEAEGALSFKTLTDAIKQAKDIAANDDEHEVFIFGGGQIYHETLPLVERLYMNKVKKTVKGDTFFPAISDKDWTIVKKESHPAGDTHPPWDFIVLERKAA